jgi:hypothetical protein
VVTAVGEAWTKRRIGRTVSSPDHLHAFSEARLDWTLRAFGLRDLDAVPVGSYLRAVVREAEVELALGAFLALVDRLAGSSTRQ